jgi:hypothetical protein
MIVSEQSLSLSKRRQSAILRPMRLTSAVLVGVVAVGRDRLSASSPAPIDRRDGLVSGHPDTLGGDVMSPADCQLAFV